MKESVILSTNEKILVSIGTKHMQNSEKPLGIKIDSKLNFMGQIGKICIKSQCQIQCFD